MDTYYISPSDITFLWTSCPRCFYKKVKLKKPRPQTIFPKMFNRIDSLMKQRYVNQNLSTISEDFPDAVLIYPDQWVQSKPLVVSKHNFQIVFRGKIDGLLEYTQKGDNGETIYGLPDLKTAEANENTYQMYGLALHTYVYCLENAADGELSASPIKELGLIIYEPSSYEHNFNEEPKLNGNHYWVEFERDMESFMEWTKTIARVLSKDTAPEATEDCSFCNWKPD